MHNVLRKLLYESLYMYYLKVFYWYHFNVRMDAFKVNAYTMYLPSVKVLYAYTIMVNA